MESAFIPWKKYLQYGLIGFVALFVYQWVNNPLVVTVLGTSSVVAKAENAVLTFSISSSGDNSEDALSKVKNNVLRLKEVLKQMGIPESEIFESQAVVIPASAVTNGANGFQSTISIGLKTSNVGNLDKIISTLYAQGANVVSQPVLTAKDSAEMDKKAYDEALKDAKKKAGKIALSNFKFIRKVVLIQESQQQSSSTITTTADEATQATEDISPEQGLIKINKAVSVSYKMW